MSNIFEEPQQFDYHEEPKPTDYSSFEAVARSRRSVRVFTNEPVPAKVINNALDLALLAPNSSNLQPWEFFWVRSPEKVNALKKACFSQPAARTAAELIVCVAHTQTWRRNCQEMLKVFDNMEKDIPKAARDYYAKLIPLMYTHGPMSLLAPFKWLFFKLVGLWRPVPREPIHSGQMKIWATKSTALACENFMLAVRAQGFDTCPMEGLDSRRVQKLLGLSRHALVTMVIAVGKRDSEKGVYGPQIRFDRENFIREV